MNKFVKKILIWSGLFLLTLVVLLVIVAALFENQISDKLVSEINKQLKTELRVGEFNLSLLSGFPDASATLHQVQLDDAMNGTLLDAENLSFQFGLFSLFGSSIKVHSIIIEDGSLYIKKDKRGKVNYEVLKSSGESTEEEDESNGFGLSLDEAKLNRMEVIYLDQFTDQYTKFQVNKAVASGEFSSEKFSMMSFADIQFHFYQSGKDKYLVDEEIIYDAKLAVDFVNGTYEFEDVTVGVASNVFTVDGLMEQIKNGWNYDLKVTSDEGSLASVIALLPPEQKAYLSDFDSKGTFYFNAAVKGQHTPKMNPAMSVEFGLEDGKISSDKLMGSLKDVSFTAKFNNGKRRSNKYSSFEITDFKSYFKKELLEASLKVTNFDDPLIDFGIDGVLPLESVYGLFASPIITDGDGDLDLKNIKLKGKYKDIISPYGIGRVGTSGEVEFDDASLTVNDQKVVFDKGSLRLRDNSLKVSELVMESPGTEVTLDGTFINLLPVLFADSLNSKKAELKFNARLDAKEMDFDKLLALMVIPVEEAEVKEAEESNLSKKSVEVVKTQKRERITKFLKGEFKATIDEFHYEKIEGEDFKGVLKFDNNQMKVKGNVKMMEGRMLVDGTTHFERKPYLEAKLICEQINLKEFFRQSENFGQEVLVDKNVKGKLDAKFFIQAYWAEDATFLTDKLHIIGDIGIANGEVVNFKMLYDFSDYVKLSDLRRIKFTKLHNYMEVKKSKIYLPAMFIQSNAMNLTVSGTHTFENKIDYNIKVNAGQVVLNKFKKHNSKLQPQKAKKNGWFNLYYRIYGPMETFTYASNKKRVKRSFDNSQVQKKRIQKQLIAQFGSIVSVEEPTDWKDVIPEYQEDVEGEDEEVEFIDFDEVDSE